MCGASWRSLTLITGVTAAVAVGGGAVLTFFYLPDVITEIRRLGDGVDWLGGLQRGSQANMYGSVLVSVLALVPILFSVEGCRKSLFEQKEIEGCCGAIKRCFQTILGVWLVTLIEGVLFLGIIWQLGISYIYFFVMGLMFISLNVCNDADALTTFGSLVQVIQNSTETTPITDFFGSLDIAVYCNDYNDNAFAYSRTVTGAGVLVLLALIITFMSVGRAKECIFRELRATTKAPQDEMELSLTNKSVDI